MKLKICVVRDSAIDAFLGLHCVQHVGGAIRGFEEECNRKDGQSQIGNHPADFELFQIGEFDQDTAVITPSAPVSLRRGSDVKLRENNSVS